MTGQPPCLVASIRKRLSDAFVLDVDLSADAGITMVFGASGSGKTTLLRCLAGLSQPDAGRIRVGDRLLVDRTTGQDVPIAQRRVGYVFQHLALFPHLSAYDNIAYGLAALDSVEQRRRVDAIAGSFQIGSLLSRRPAALSGGERQRVALARSLVTDPSLLLLDEPLSALDHRVQSLIMADLRAWNASRRIPIIYVTHSHREVFALGERVVALDAGRVVADGTPHEVLDMPTHEGLAQTAGFENLFDATIVARRAAAGTMQCRLGGPHAARRTAGTARVDLADRVDLEVPLTGGVEGSVVRVAIRAGDILLATEPPRGLSARNILSGTIDSLRAEGTTVVAEVTAGERFVVHLTPGARESLGLTEGRAVWLIIKTHSCRTVT